MEAIIIGQGSFAEHCGEHWFSQGHSVRACCSQDGSLERWADRQGIPHVRSIRGLEALLAEEDVEVDVLWSLNNPSILGADLIGRARRYAINYHDSPLPKYAGLFATTWALADQAAEHAITFHVVEPGIDTGDILKQSPVAVLPVDTAHSLNLRCFQRACAAFAVLVDELAAGTERPTPQPCHSPCHSQNRGERSYFGHADRPLPACVLDLTQPHERLSACARALDFGSSDNPVGSPRLLTRPADGAGQLRATGIDELTWQPARQSKTPTGHVVNVDREHSRLVVQADGGQWELQVSANAGSLPNAGDRVLSPGETPGGSQTLSAVQGAASRTESRWRRRVMNAGPAQHPRLVANNSVALAGTDTLRVAAGAHTTPRARLSELLAFFGRFHPEGVGHLQLLDPANPDWTHGLGECEQLTNELNETRAALMSRRVPVAMELRRGQPFAAFASRVDRWLSQLQRDGGYLFDLHTRYPGLPALPSGPDVVSVRLNTSSNDLHDDSPGLPDATASSSGLVVSIERDGDLLFTFGPEQPRAEAAALVGDFKAFCEQLAQCRADTALTEVPLMDATSWQQVVVDWNETSVTRVGPKTLCDAFAATVARHGDRIAIVDPTTTSSPTGASTVGGELSYAQLDADSSAVARALRNRGVTEGQLVGIHIERSSAQLVTVLGVLKAGAAYLPLDPAYPEERNRQVTELARPACVVSQGDAKAPPESVPFDSLLDTGRACHTPLPTVPASALAYVIFTSGSTGVPKGVPIQHAALLNHAQTFIERMGLAPGGRVLQSASLSFDIGAEQIFPALLSGAALVLRTPKLLESFAGISSFITAHSVTAVSFPTGLWQAWLGHLARTDSQVPSCLRVVGTGTEKVQTWALTEWRKRAPAGCRWFQGYGPTETTITCIAHEDDGEEVPDLGVPIGRPLPNVQAFVVDPQLQPVPVGCPGELLIAGAGLSPGYLGNPEETAKRFVLTQHLGRPDLRVYRTGDMVVQDASGRLTFLGRRDNQVKIAGYRVELGDIEAHIADLSSIDAVAVVVAGNGDRKQLVAHLAVQMAEERDAAVATLVDTVKAHVRAHLPAFMVPAAVVVHECLPTLANGKVDRRGLAQQELAPQTPAQQQTGGAASEEVPEFNPALRPSSLEDTLADLWKSCLEVSEVHACDDFFDLGGTSLAAMRLCSDIEHTLQTPLSLGQVFKHRTLRAMAACLEAELEHSTRDEPVAFTLTEGNDPKAAPLFLFCGIFVYDKLARELAGKRTCVAFSIPEEQRAFSDAGAPGAASQPTIQALAADYVAEIRRQAPRGPYHLVGLSAGGVIAFEAARQLTAAGAEVGLVAALDTILPSALVMTPSRRLRAWTRELFEGGPKALATKLADGVHGRLAQVMSQWLGARPSSAPRLSSGLEAPGPDDGQDIGQVHDSYRSRRGSALGAMVSRYAEQPRPLKLRRGRGGGPRFVLFNAQQSPWHRHSPSHLGFAPWVDNKQRVIHVDCGHMDLVKGHDVVGVARALDRAAKEAEAAPKPRHSSSFPLPPLPAEPLA